MDLLGLFGGALSAAAGSILSTLVSAVTLAVNFLLSRVTDVLEDWSSERLGQLRGWLASHVRWPLTRNQQTPDSGKTRLRGGRGADAGSRIGFSGNPPYVEPAD